MAVTPMMRQYLEIKDKYRDAILFYRLGDFYEMFYDDAILVSRELELTLTGRNCGEGERAPMCGVPFHSADSYIGKLVSNGHKVVICEQMEDPATANGLVKRDIVRIITPGTVIDNSQLSEGRNNYLCAICYERERMGLAFVDVSTGELTAMAIEGDNAEKQVLNELGVYNPGEILVNLTLDIHPEIAEFVKRRMNVYVSENQGGRYEYKHAYGMALKQFGSEVIEPYRKISAIISSVGALLDYISETQMTDVNNITKLNVCEVGQYLEIDVSSRRNLEICETMRTKEKRGSLLWVLDRTKSAAGARMLRRWLEMPLLNAAQIGRRQRAVAELTSSFMQREEIADNLRRVLDLDRLMTKLIYGTANPRDLRAIASTAAVIPEIRILTGDFISEELVDIHRHIDDLSDLRQLVDAAIVDEPPAVMRDGGYIRRGYSAEADELYEIVHNGKSFLEELTVKERERTGIKNLKISYNRVFGYYIEVTKSNVGDVPDNYIRKQTLVGSERYITEELKEKEAMILGAADKLTALEYELFTEVREKIASNIKRVQYTAELLAKLDCYVSLAEVAVRNGYSCPEIEYGNVISIKEGRHPVIEQFTTDGYFVPNDTLLDTNHNRLMLITGPNMAGKSTYMRQVALITLMAQIGSFVPAKEARIGIVDKIFTRVGASDDLASGQSTFMLEMNEVAYILKNATKRSLIIYDEIGRGTSTYDGMSIARAVAEYTAGKKIGAKTMFATHYHELVELEKKIDGVVNYNIAAKKNGDDIIFLRKIVKGGTDDSYGIEVAKLAGVPNEVIKRAKDVLKQLGEQGKIQKVPTLPEPNSNITFDDYKAAEVRDKVKNIDVNLLTPIEAINLLSELKKMAE